LKEAVPAFLTADVSGLSAIIIATADDAPTAIIATINKVSMVFSDWDVLLRDNYGHTKPFRQGTITGKRRSSSQSHD